MTIRLSDVLKRLNIKAAVLPTELKKRVSEYQAMLSQPADPIGEAAVLAASYIEANLMLDVMAWWRSATRDPNYIRMIIGGLEAA